MSKFNRYTKTKQLLQNAKLSEAWATYRFKNYSQIEGSYPYYATHAKGAYVWDVDGNKYIDYMLGYGSVILGHSDDRVNNAVIREVQNGTNLSPLWKPIHIELTDLIKSIIPNSEMIYLMRSGSDATSGAIRLARAYTKRKKIIRWGYHGWHDWSTGILEGVPKYIKSDIFELKYNDIDSVKKLFQKHPNQIACVIMMPFELEEPKNNFLAQVIEEAHRNGSLFILDEMRSGFRISLGGAQQYFEIQADLATFSKAIANGYSISAIAGKREVLSKLRDVQMAATYFANSVEIAAAIETLNVLKTTDSLSHIWNLGKLLKIRTEQLIIEYDIPAEFVGYPPFPFIRFNLKNKRKKEQVKKTFFTEAARLGVFIHPNHHWYISAAHSRKDIKDTIKIFEHAFQTVRKTQDSSFNSLRH